MKHETLYFFATFERRDDMQLRKRVLPADRYLGPGANTNGLRAQQIYIEVPFMTQVNHFVQFSNWLTYDIRTKMTPGNENNIIFIYTWMMGR